MNIYKKQWDFNLNLLKTLIIFNLLQQDFGNTSFIFDCKDISFAQNKFTKNNFCQKKNASF